MTDQLIEQGVRAGTDHGPADQPDGWSAYYDRVEAALRVLAERVAAGAELTEPGWTLLPPPADELPAELLPRHDRVLAHLSLLTDATQIRTAALRRELDALPHHAVVTPGTTALGRSLDVFG